jgi:hypothetical protein
MFSERRNQSGGLVLTNPHQHLNTGVSQLLQTLTGHMRRRILTPHNDSSKSSRQHCLNTRWSLSEVTAGLKRYKQILSMSPAGGVLNRMNLGMRTTKDLMIPFGDPFALW